MNIYSNDNQTSSDSIDIRQYIYLIWQWAWLIAIAVVLAAAIAYYVSSRQTPVYESTTKILISRPAEESNNQYYSYYDAQQVSTYVQMITTQPLMDIVSEQLGFTVTANQVSASQISETTILSISVTDTDPQRAALIANTLVTVFSEYNDTLQASRYEESETSLQNQMAQVENQIQNIQSQIQTASTVGAAQQRTQVEGQISDVQAQIAALQVEIQTYQSYVEQTPTPSSSNATPTPLAAYQTTLSEKESQLAQLQSILTLYQEIYANLVVEGQTTNTNANDQISSLQTNLALYQQIYSNLLNSYENIRLARLSSSTNVVQLEPALPPDEPIRPQPMQSALLAGAVGLMLTVGIIFLVEFLDDTVKNPDEITNRFQVPVVGIITHHDTGNGHPIAQVEPRSPVAEAFRSIRTNLRYASVDRTITRILVTSPMPGDGKTTIAVNLAISLAQSGSHVTIMDADMRRPSLHRALSIKNRVGLSTLFVQRTLHIEGSIQSTKIPNLTMVSSGEIPPNPSELLGSIKMQEIIDSIQKQTEVLVIDTPPIMSVTDAVVLSPLVDGVVLVVRPGATKMDALKHAIEQLRRVNANIIGVVLNDIQIQRTRYRYYRSYYSYYYHQPYSNGERQRVKQQYQVTQEPQPPIIGAPPTWDKDSQKK
jgi:capsular exopolysaccharide synthesis family protein